MFTGCSQFVSPFVSQLSHRVFARRVFHRVFSQGVAGLAAWCSVRVALCVAAGAVVGAAAGVTTGAAAGVSEGRWLGWGWVEGEGSLCDRR